MSCCGQTYYRQKSTSVYATFEIFYLAGGGGCVLLNKMSVCVSAVWWRLNNRKVELFTLTLIWMFSFFRWLKLNQLGQLSVQLLNTDTVTGSDGSADSFRGLQQVSVNSVPSCNAPSLQSAVE